MGLCSHFVHPTVYPISFLRGFEAVYQHRTCSTFTSDPLIPLYPGLVHFRFTVARSVYVCDSTGSAGLHIYSVEAPAVQILPLQACKASISSWHLNSVEFRTEQNSKSDTVKQETPC